MNNQQLLQRIESANSPDFGNILSKSFDLFKKVWMDGFLHLLVTALASIPVMIIIYLPFLPVVFQAIQTNDRSEFSPVVFDYSIGVIIVYVVVILVVIVLTQVLSIGITAHYFKVCKDKDLESQEEDGGYFSYLKGGNFGKLFVLSMATFGVAILASILCFIPLIYVMVPLQLIVVIFAFNDHLSVSEIISISFKLGNKFWFLVFGLIIVSSMIAQLGAILCLVGMFFTAYFAHIPIYYFYKETIGFGNGSDELTKEFSTEYLN